jgi:hypothetical protein
MVISSVWRQCSGMKLTSRRADRRKRLSHRSSAEMSLAPRDGAGDIATSLAVTSSDQVGGSSYATHYRRRGHSHYLQLRASAPMSSRHGRHECRAHITKSFRASREIG